MWAHYSRGMRGYCIEYDADKVRRSLNQLCNYAEEPIRYSENVPQVEMKDAMKWEVEGSSRLMQFYLECLLNKSGNPWSLENELRFLCETSKSKGPLEHGTISAIYIGYLADESTRDELIRQAKEKQVPCKRVRINHDSPEYQLGFEDIDVNSAIHSKWNIT